MTIRTTDVHATEMFIEKIFLQKDTLNNIRNQVSSGIKIASASDDPGRAGTITELQATEDRLTRHKERITVAESVLGVQSTVLDQVQDIILRAREIGEQAANGTVPYEVRNALSEEVFQLREQMIGVVNTRFKGSYLYSGTDDDDAPYGVAATGYTNPGVASNELAGIRYIFDGDRDVADLDFAQERAALQTARTINITDTDSVRINSDGGDIFRKAIYGLEKLGRALAGYRTDAAPSPMDPATDIPNGAGTAYTQPGDFYEQTQDILDSMDILEDASVNSVEIERTSVGSRLARLSEAYSILDVILLDTQKARSGIQDVDMLEAASRLSSMEVSLQALLTSGARINNLSLLNFI